MTARSLANLGAVLVGLWFIWCAVLAVAHLVITGAAFGASAVDCWLLLPVVVSCAAGAGAVRARGWLARRACTGGSADDTRAIAAVLLATGLATLAHGVVGVAGLPHLLALCADRAFSEVSAGLRVSLAQVGLGTLLLCCAGPVARRVT